MQPKMRMGLIFPESIQALNNYPILLPPIEEQARIVSRIECLEAPLAVARSKITIAARLTGNLRRLILRRAVSGQLSQAWRESQKVEKKRSDRNLPARWKQIRIGDVGDVQVGRQRAPKHHAGEHMRPYLRVANVFEDYIDTTDIMRMNFSPREYEIYQLKHGDVLLNEGQSLELVGRPAMFRDEIPGAAFTNTIIRFRAGPKVRSEFALLVFREYFHGGQFQKIAKITTNLAHLGLKRFADLPFPMPPIEEQDEIVAACARCFAMLKVTERLFVDILEDSEDLAQSILSRGTGGHLVPQVSGDVDAFTLVERLANEKASRTPLSGDHASARRARRNLVREITPVIATLTAARKSLSSKELFLQCGYPDDASSEQVERFFLDLRASLRGGRITRTREGDEDIFNLMER